MMKRSSSQPSLRIRGIIHAFSLLLSAVALQSISAQEAPYFVTYSHHMEQPGNLEIGFSPSVVIPKHGPHGVASLLELEYGTTGWWTTELYLEGQTTPHEGTLFTGWRVENRFRPLLDDYPVNPVLYIEYEDITGADKTLKEVVGFDSTDDLEVPNAIARREHKHEIEAKLILSSDSHGWNISENFIAEKNLAGNPWEFGYAIGTSRPLRLAASSHACTLCTENFTAGLEAYGGLGQAGHVSLARKSHYVGPLIAWTLPNHVSLRLSPALGVTSRSARMLLRLGVSYEFR